MRKYTGNIVLYYGTGRENPSFSDIEVGGSLIQSDISFSERGPRRGRSRVERRLDGAESYRNGLSVEKVADRGKVNLLFPEKYEA